MRKNNIYILFTFALLLCSTSCTKYQFEDTGTANGNHETSMWGYFQTDSYNWDSLMVMARHAGLQEVFEGTSKYGTDITFLGITNHSIRRYILQNKAKGWIRVTDIPVEDCRTFILSSILDEHIKLEEFIEGAASTDKNQPIGTGGKIYTTLSGKQLWIYTFHEAYNGVAGAGPLKIYIVSPDKKKTTIVASSNIMTQTGIVHSLPYSFTLNDF